MPSTSQNHWNYREVKSDDYDTKEKGYCYYEVYNTSFWSSAEPEYCETEDEAVKMTALLNNRDK